VNIKICVCQIIGPAAAGSAGPVPTALWSIGLLWQMAVPATFHKGVSIGSLDIAFCAKLKMAAAAILFRWRFGSVGNVVGRINKVNQRRARLVLGWVTICRWVNHLGM